MVKENATKDKDVTFDLVFCSLPDLYPKGV
jgi:hypothetical protein